MVVGFIRGYLVKGCAMGFFRFRCRSVASSGSFGSFEWDLGDVGFVWGCWVRSSAPWGSFGFIRGRLVRSGAPSGVAFILSHWVRSRTTWGSLGRCVQLETMGLFGSALGMVGFI